MPSYSPEKNREYQRTWYLKNKKLQIERNKLNIRRKRKYVLRYKEKRGCYKCGERDHRCLEFHHMRILYEKEYNIAYMLQVNLSLERIKNEIKKCKVICANCHRKLHLKLKY